MIVIGLTGSIGMGKSATADMFRAEGVPVHDSDAEVHALYRGPAVALIAKHFPSAIVEGRVDRAKLGAEVIGKSERMHLLELLVHPLVEQSRTRFMADCRTRRASIAVLDIPLLFEIGGERFVDLVAVCNASDDVQESRVLARSGMTREMFHAIRARQLANNEKRQRAHVVVDTSSGFDYARAQVRALIRALSATA